MAATRAALQELLATLGESTQFVVSASLPAVLPGLEVQGIGPIGTPVSAADARRLIAQAEQAPYGRGEQTIVDTEVRRVWQIEPANFSLENDEWNGHLAAMVEAVRKEFGISQKVKAELYKLLIYEQGSFFAPHRDTEKSKNMFATLAVCLPSRHEGGALVVQHDGRTRRIEFGGKNSQFKTQFAAFYADCQHEIEPVTAGYRICLIYNLATAGKRQPAAPENSAAVVKAAELMRALFADPTGPVNKIAIPLQHQYTEAGLDPAQLKGADRGRADVLVRAAEKLDFACYFALLTHWQSGSPDYSTMDYDPYRRRDSYGWSDDDEEDDSDEDDDSSDETVEMEEVFDEALSLDHWLDPAGRTQDFGEIHLDEREILTLDSREGWARTQEIQEATGNAGASMERWYRQGVVVVWPRDRTFRILAGEGQRAALPELQKMIGRGKPAAALADCQKFAAEIVSHWKPRQTSDAQRGYSRDMLAALEKIEADKITERFVRDVLPQDFDGSEGTVLLRLGERRGWQKLGPALKALIDKQQPSDCFARLLTIVSVCRPLCCEALPLVGERRSVCQDLAEALAQAIERWDRESVVDEDDDYEAEDSRAGVVEGAIHIFSTVGGGERLDQFLARALADKRRYSLHRVLIPDCKSLLKRLPEAPQVEGAAHLLLEHCRAQLQAATAHPVERPQDWAREAKLDCGCEDCKALAKFLRDPAAKVGRFSIRQDRRQHLHRQIDHNRCDCTHVTERKGSPQTLVCTKTQASYQRRLKQFQVDLELLAELDALASSPKGTAVPPPKLKRAPKRRVGRKPSR